MTASALETLLRVALPPLRLALRERHLVVRRRDAAAAKPSAALIGSCEKVARQVPASMLVRWSL